MAELAAFLKKYDTIIFDMDGVITSEQHYWTCAALAVWEWTHSSQYYGNDSIDVGYMAENAAQIRAEVFQNDRTIELLKGKGVNSNWDLGYVVFAACRILGTLDFAKVYSFCEELSDNILDEYPHIAAKLGEITGTDCERNAGLWTAMVHTFQEWFLGDELFKKQFGKRAVNPGKKGFVYSEKPIIPQEVLTEIFTLLIKSGKRLATGTGRPSNELYPPLNSFGIYDRFAPDGIINHDHVMQAERETGENLTKPHPYIFVKAMMGEAYSDNRIAKGDYDREKVKTTLVVGDAGADILAAKAMGADFCAVLTGVSGTAARAYFVQQGAEYILASLAEFIA